MHRRRMRRLWHCDAKEINWNGNLEKKFQYLSANVVRVIVKNRSTCSSVWDLAFRCEMGLKTGEGPCDNQSIQWLEFLQRDSGMSGSSESKIKDVWSGNLEEEMEKIMAIVEHYPYVAVDTEFPGVVARPVGSFKNAHDYHYQTLKTNVDLLRVIQIGITLMDENGILPPKTSTWQFNFEFNLNRDIYSDESIALLEAAGLDFKRHEENGIDPKDFGELVTVSGLVLNDDIRWIAFHGAYDFAYFFRMVSGLEMPDEESDFFNLISYYFPHIYDVKHLMRFCNGLSGGLQKLAEDLKLSRVGVEHQSGSDSLLTGIAFFSLKGTYFQGSIEDDKFDRIIYGLGDFNSKLPPRQAF